MKIRNGDGEGRAVIREKVQDTKDWTPDREAEYPGISENDDGRYDEEKEKTPCLTGFITNSHAAHEPILSWGPGR